MVFLNGSFFLFQWRTLKNDSPRRFGAQKNQLICNANSFLFSSYNDGLSFYCCCTHQTLWRTCTAGDLTLGCISYTATRPKRIFVSADMMCLLVVDYHCEQRISLSRHRAGTLLGCVPNAQPFPRCGFLFFSSSLLFEVFRTNWPTFSALNCTRRLGHCSFYGRLMASGNIFFLCLYHVWLSR